MSDKRHRLALPGNTGRMRPSDHNNSRDAQIAAADYVATQAMELSQLCRGLGLDTLGYLLDMARLEAENLSRNANGRGLSS